MSTSTSGASKFFPKAQEGFSTTTSGTISSGAVTVGLNSTGNYTNGDTVVLIVDPGVSGKEQSFTGVIDTSGVQVTGVVWTSGTNVAHSSGATVVDYVAAAHIDLISAGILVSHNADGTPKTGVTYPASTFTTPTITDFTNADHTHATVAQGGQLTEAAFANNAITAKLLATNAISLGRGTNTSSTVLTAGAGDASIASTTVTIPSGGRDVEIIAYIPNLTAGGAANGVFKIFKSSVGGTQLNSQTIKWQDSGDQKGVNIVAYDSAVSAGSATYILSGAATSNNLQYNVGSTAPALISVKVI